MPLPIRLVKLLAKAVGIRKLVKAALLGPKRRRVGACRAARFSARFAVEEWPVEDGWAETIRLAAPLRSIDAADRPKAAPRRHIVFLHGGGYASEASPMHRLFLASLVRRHGFLVTNVDYPLVPEHTAADTHRALLQAYRDVAARNPGDVFFLMGDSAGGGLALAFRQVLRDLAEEAARAGASDDGAAPRPLPMPQACVLISPWLDVTLSNPGLADDAARDPVLSVDGCVAAGLRYAGAIDPKDPRVSPAFGRMEDLGSVLVFCGTEEVFRSDCVDLAARLDAARGSSCEIRVEEGMAHDWVLAPVREARAARARIADFLRRFPDGIADAL